VRGFGTGRWKNWIGRRTPAETALTISTMIPAFFGWIVLVGRAAVAQMVAELDRGRHAATDRDQLGDRLLPEIDRPRLVIALLGDDLLAHVPVQRRC
jgi:hypothetical protein